MESGDAWLLSRVLFLIPLLLSLSIHEWAHAWSAWRLGDDTAARLGRLTLNPLEHIDPIGTLLLPLCGIPFGWAKPVPINPVRFRRGVSQRGGIALTAAAGPLSNLCLAFLATGLLAGLVRLGPGLEGGAVRSMLETMVLLNLVLAAFNSLPLPPLDGSRIVEGVLPDRWQPAWSQLARLGPVALAALILAPSFLGLSLLSAPFDRLRHALDALIRALG